MAQTSNYKLRTYTASDKFTITDAEESFNNNMFIIDDEIKRVDNQLVNVQTSASAALKIAQEDVATLVTEKDSASDSTKIAYSISTSEIEVPTVEELEELKTELTNSTYGKDEVYSKTEADNKYYSKTEADNKYLAKTDLDLSNKVDAEEGKALSSNDYDDEAKAKVDAIPVVNPIAMTIDGYLRIQY